VREIAGSSGLSTAQKKESQEICFVPDGDYGRFIERHAGDVNETLLPFLERSARPGAILFKDGTPLGNHRGVHQFTVGQRRGLGIAHSRPLYVLRLNVEKNTVTVGYREDLFSHGLMADRVNWISGSVPEDPVQARVRVRSRHQEASATITLKKHNGQGCRAEVLFDAPQMSVTPGQAAVFYQGERVLGGGWITGRI
jgi:tRNA-specific 2-thiouridylase